MFFDFAGSSASCDSLSFFYRKWCEICFFCFIFFSGKVFVKAQIYFLRGLTVVFFQVLFVHIVKKQENSTVEQQSFEGNKKRDQLLVSTRKWHLIFKFLSDKKIM